MNNIVTFPGTPPPARKRRAKYGSRPCCQQINMHTALFRSRETILQSDEADLVRDVCFDIDKAQRKLARIRARIEKPAGICSK
jgi:hypothetical protein